MGLLSRIIKLESKNKYDGINSYSARVANNGTATITSQSSPNTPAIASVNRTGAGYVAVTFTVGFFTVIPSITGTTEVNAQNFATENLSLTGFNFKTFDVVSAESLADRDATFVINRQGTDCRN